MGNIENSTIDINKETLIWIDKNINNKENIETFRKYKEDIRLRNFNFLIFSNVNSAIELMKTNPYFEYRLFYVIVSGRLAEEYFTEYVKLSEIKSIVAANIVFCFNIEFHQTKPYFKDQFINSGKIAFVFEEIVNYILKDECEWGKRKREGYSTEKEDYSNIIIHASELKDMALQIQLDKLFNSSFLNNDDIEKFQDLLLKRYWFTGQDKINNYLIKPSGNKNIRVPNHLLTRYFLRLYTLNSSFYYDLNKDLSNGKFDDYLTFIFLLYDAINNKTLSSYKDDSLYRKELLSNMQFNDINNKFKQSQKNSQIKTLFFSKKFSYFSKIKDTKFGFMENSNDSVPVLFVLKKPDNKDFFVTNIDIENINESDSEKNVLFLPLSCFEIKNIQKEDNYYLIELNYLDSYENELKQKYEEFNNNSSQTTVDEFFEKSLKSEYGQTFTTFYKNMITNIFANYGKYLNVSPNNTYYLNKVGKDFSEKINEFL